MAHSATVEAGDSPAYQNKLLGLLGDRDPIEVMSKTPVFIRRVVAENAAATLRARPFAGKWTPLEIIGHLVDTEWVYGYRIRLILCEDKPTILGMDQDLWVARQRYNEREPRELAEQYALLRETNLRVWHAMGPAELARVGRHNERGEESLGLMLKMEAGHDLSHIDQITRYIAAVRGA